MTYVVILEEKYHVSSLIKIFQQTQKHKCKSWARPINPSDELKSMKHKTRVTEVLYFNFYPNAIGFKRYIQKFN